MVFNFEMWMRLHSKELFEICFNGESFTAYIREAVDIGDSWLIGIERTADGVLCGIIEYHCLSDMVIKIHKEV